MTPYSHHTEIIRRLLRAHAIHRAEKVLDKIPAKDLGPLVRSLEPSDARPLCELLLSPGRVQRTLREMPRADHGALMLPFDDNHLTDLLGRLPAARSRELLKALPEGRRRQIEAQVQRHVPMNATAEVVMHPPSLSLSRNTTTQAAIDEIRRVYHEGEMFYLYVHNDAGHLEGVLPFRRLVTSPAETQIHVVMTPRPTVLRPSTGVKEAAKLFGMLDVLALPVVDDAGQLVGLVHAEDVLDLLGEDEAVTPTPPVPTTTPNKGTTPPRWAEWFPFGINRRSREQRPATKNPAWVGG